MRNSYIIFIFVSLVVIVLFQGLCLSGLLSFWITDIVVLCMTVPLLGTEVVHAIKEGRGQSMIIPILTSLMFGLSIYSLVFHFDDRSDKQAPIGSQEAQTEACEAKLETCRYGLVLAQATIGDLQDMMNERNDSLKACIVGIDRCNAQLKEMGVLLENPLGTAEEPSPSP